MVDDLLDTSRITRGTIRLQTELVQPAEVIGRAIEAMRHLAEAKGHQLCVSMRRTYRSWRPTRRGWSRSSQTS